MTRIKNRPRQIKRLANRQQLGQFRIEQPYNLRRSFSHLIAEIDKGQTVFSCDIMNVNRF